MQHAHQKGVIHRDLKPSNVLISLQDGEPAPKVIDFGIAKATSTQLTEKTVFTQQQQLIGTPEYMSPEQAEISGIDIDTRSDIYSLGVLLYELLAGVLPFDARSLRSVGYTEIQRIIREQVPPRPSTKLSSLDTAEQVARAGHTEPRRLGALIRGDLDWIVMKARIRTERAATRRRTGSRRTSIEPDSVRCSRRPEETTKRLRNWSLSRRRHPRRLPAAERVGWRTC